MAAPNVLFAVLNVADFQAVEAALDHIQPWVWLKLEDGQWLIVAPNATTSKEVSDKLGFAEMNGIVLRVETYFGRGPRSVWEWITAKQGAELGAQV